MNRTKMIAGILVMLVAASWVTTFIFYSRLPAEIPVHFSMDKEIPGMGPKWMFLIFPGLNTLFAAMVFLGYFFRKHLNFIGKERLKDLPPELTEPVFNRVYQITMMIFNFVSMLLIYIQINIALYTMGRIDRFNYEVIFIVAGVIMVYSLFSFFTVNKMTKLAAQLYQEWQEEKGE